MSVTSNEISFYGSANSPEADNLTVGGAIDITRRVTFADMTATSLLDVVSSSASDTATKIAYYTRDATGVINNETLTLTGQTKVPGTKTSARLLYAALSGATANGPVAAPTGTAAVGDVALMAHTPTIAAHTCQAGSANATGTTPPVIKLQAGDGASVTLGMVIRTTGGTGANQIRMAMSLSGSAAGQYGTDIIAVNRAWGTIPDATTTYEIAPGFLFDLLPNPVTSITRPFATVASDVVGGASRTYVEKIFALNTDGSTALTAASIIKQADPTGLYTGGGALNIALCTALNDTGTVANRQTAVGSGIGAYSTGAAPQTVAVPAPGNLVSGNAVAQAQGIWLQLVLPAGLAPANGSFTLRGTGGTI